MSVGFDDDPLVPADVAEETILERQLKRSIANPKRGDFVAPRGPQIPAPSSRVDLGQWTDITPLDKALDEIFAKRGMERSGGASGYGWSSRALFEQCEYKFYLRHRAPKTRLPVIPERSDAREVGALWHQLLCFRYLRLMDRDAETIDNGELRDELLAAKCSSESVMEAYRLYTYYEARYENDYLRPLAVEEKFAWREHTCRYDLIAEVEDNPQGIFPGIYIVEHKSAARFDSATLDGWKNDGEILGQEMIWRGLKLDKKFGRLAGVIVNLESKIKLPDFQRIVLPPRPRLVRKHEHDLKVMRALEMNCDATGSWPRRRAACVGRYGKCEYFDHCAEE